MDLTCSSGDDPISEEDSASDNYLGSEVEVFPLDEDSKDSGEDNEDSDQDDDEDQEDSSEERAETSSRPWGFKKSVFYGAEEGSSSGDDLEEQEAKDLQKNKHFSLTEHDFMSHWFQEDEQLISSHTESVPDVSSKVQDKDSVRSVLAAFDSHFCWLLEFGLPAVKSCDELKMSPHGCKYLYVKVHMLFCSCINLLHYLHQNLNFNNEALYSKRMLELNQLLLQVSDVDKELEQVIQKPPATSSSDIQGTVSYSMKKKKTSEELHYDALHFYETVKQDQLKKKKKTRVEPNIEQVIDVEDEDDKRAITFEMARNKGLTPSRKKEQRNPRVKHRKKYRKALIRRKGQVLPVLPELTKYGGEGSGIRSGLARSVSLK